MTAVASDAPSPAPVDDETPHSDRGLGIFLAVSGAIALWSSLILTYDKIDLLQAEVAGTAKDLGCDLSAFVSCSDVVSSDQSEVFGFPNTFIGAVAFAVVVTLGVVLASGVSLPRWIWGGLQVGVLFGIGFVTWLQYQAIWEIGKLCPWCMVVWAVMIPMFVAVTARFTGSRFLKNWTVLISALWIIAVIAVIWFEFGETLWA
ncbi:vitamin K epoxide reductase family protein [Aeromicrobium duanguangcaii]|uniref:Vitamin K epoxide reductase family protein n=1 Tax=Aeromicrobium duanguangcaii TaxID=2968086 RepID=A0ABY5KDH4_9ACTN|nr:vitamin K epoxide reductase family protein [Aeromicrobium duanguangcaii]MCD9154666.1 vitamin K epoxide reductase family protein [Aeromicrobium duanguangcaii]MCL3838788.1 vitamin K epoxide reductase family protein [Aeromicrobium duanguangcaii]UUI67920.1 vitamin K epoxide reductase family protein [Aeromicrobium duanguangcaii]